MKYAEIMENDTVNCMEGITVSLFMSGWNNPLWRN